MVTIYHNPQWSKSRKSVEILNELGVNFKIIEYTKSGFTINEIKSISKKLKLKPNNFIRFNDKFFKNNSNYNKQTDCEKLTKLIVKYPKLIERPIIIKENNAIIARPPELINDFLLQ